MDDRLTLRAAYLYYRAGLTQAQVADRLGVSRVKVGRLIASALARGIVTIDISHPLSRVTEMEVALENRFGLRDAVVAASPAGRDEDELRLLAVASAGADYLRSLELADTQIAIGWGTTMQAVSNALRDGWAENLDIYQLNGAVPVSGFATRAGEIMSRFGQRSNSRPHLLQVPAIVDRSEVRVALESDRSVQRSLEGARTAPVAMFSLGNLRPDSVLVSSGYVAEPDIESLRERGAVGDMISRFVREDGSVADVDLDDRTMGIELARLGTRERAIGIAAGAAKAPIARAAIAGGHLNTLVVDDRLAGALLGLGDPG
jgi:deoxyribonucleoside regulator